MNCQNLVEVMIDSSKLCRLSYSGNTAISFSLNASGPLGAEYTMLVILQCGLPMVLGMLKRLNSSQT